MTLIFTTVAHKPYVGERSDLAASYSVFLDLTGKKQNQMSTTSDKKKPLYRNTYKAENTYYLCHCNFSHLISIQE
jgi:hypothetical protein